ncbi:HD domain-containing phosphohydrolase [Pseudocolwellia agarivorans]|uniref:HD domain-containing phosphohydrolase n=1 Tax=Pseudocolwellia agarivorans TaxID=1911682 RepID=UPI00098756E7|nr:HD domain-containing phosphohydrolase [Pseudocolwellia agarivorans]
MNNKYLNETVFQHLLKISIELSSEENTEILMEKVLIAAMTISNADAGSIYMVDQDKSAEFRTVLNNSLNLHLGGSSNNPITFPSIPLFIDGQPNKSAMIAHAINSTKVINIKDVYDELPYDLSAARKMDKDTGYRTQSMLTFPLKDHIGDIIGAIQIINAQENNDQGEPVTVEFTPEVEEQILSFASLGAIALTNKALIKNMEELFESFAQTIAAVIDEKSPHTGGHCKRVPELTLLIADAVHDEDKGPLASFTLTPQERHQLDIAGWLHDCGKIVTPDHIIDKSTKLETIFDRIHFIDSKFEIAKRDIDIRFQKSMIKALKKGNIIEVQQLERASDVAHKQLNLDRAFIQKINIGGEFLTDQQEQHIKEIAARYSIVINREKQSLLTEDEVTNLCIKRGTLNDKERLIIQHHMDVTSDILEALPFPKHLSNVAEYALGHHETMDGKGYPKGLTKEQMSVPARLMAVADIFEALSASDRPYKKAKPVSECLTIMGKLVLNNHLDGDIFTIFVRSKVYETYILKFATPEQLDDFNIEDIPGLSHYN